jgi:NADP-dependent 3-hydroxy acid dehydrogenase YdfG
MGANDVTSSAAGGPAGPVGPGRVAVVTGAASGIGLGLAERFAAEGMRVVMADVRVL